MYPVFSDLTCVNRNVGVAMLKGLSATADNSPVLTLRRHKNRAAAAASLASTPAAASLSTANLFAAATTQRAKSLARVSV